ncbi:MAG: hypothetical protein F6K32_25635 [Desertifilum sp. SIO1I2]|nr:hypothetical protein [Desertifilum sp. SIO1I2]
MRLIVIALGVVAFNRSDREIQITIPQIDPSAWLRVNAERSRGIEIIIHQPHQEQR